MTSCCSVVLGGLGYAYLPARKPQKWDDVTLAEALTVPLTRGHRGLPLLYRIRAIFKHILFIFFELVISLFCQETFPFALCLLSAFPLPDVHV